MSVSSWMIGRLIVFAGAEPYNFNYCIEDFAMPLARRVLNAFTAREVGDITGLSLPMINYLRREDMLVPSYGEG